MKHFRRIFLTLAFSSATFAVAANIPRSILPDNVVICQANAGCFDKTLFGRSYKVLSTSRFTVMVSVSKEGSYTRADISISNNTGLPLNLNPDDFRVEVLSPKFKTLSYVSPADLKHVPSSPAIPPMPPEQIDAAVSYAPRLLAASTMQDSTPDDYAAIKKREAQQEAYDKAVAQQHLAAVSISPNEVIRGRVYFQRDKHAQLVNLVFPVAGLVFEFPYQMNR
jgi:hypothetical protein